MLIMSYLMYMMLLAVTDWEGAGNWDYMGSRGQVTRIISCIKRHFSKQPPLQRGGAGNWDHTYSVLWDIGGRRGQVTGIMSFIKRHLSKQPPPQNDTTERASLYTYYDTYLSPRGLLKRIDLPACVMYVIPQILLWALLGWGWCSLFSSSSSGSSQTGITCFSCSLASPWALSSQQLCSTHQ